VLDARFDSAEVFGNWYLPAVSAPAGNIVIATPMTYLSSTATHPTLSKIERGTTNNQILRVRVIMSSTGAPVSVSQLNLDVAGSANPLTNIDSIIVWYTGANPNFVSPTFYGSAGPQSGPYIVTGVQNLLNDTNYFWVTYRVPVTATIGDSVDAEIASITVAGTPQIPSVTAPAGARLIRAPYCASGATSNADSDLGHVTITSGSTTLLNNGIGCTPSNNNSSANGTYSNFTGLTPANIPAGTIANVTLCYVSSGFEYASQAAIYIDFNDNGLWDAGEMVWNSTTATTPNVNNIHAGTFTIPTGVAPGIKRMRIVLIETTIPLTLANSCGTYNWGETEDYLVNITAFPGTTAYVWNQTSPALFNTASNWTPGRNLLNVADKLVFNSGTNVTVNEVANQTVSVIEVTNNTVVNMNASSAANLGASDSLVLTSGRVNNSANVTLSSGSTTTNANVTGSGKVSGALMYWVNNTAASYTYPLVQGNLNRTVMADVIVPPATRGTVTAQFIPGLPGNSGLPFNDGSINVNRIAETGYWRLTAGNGITPAPGTYYNLSLQADSFAGVVTLSTLTIARRADVSSPWDTAGTYVAATGTNASPIANRTFVRVFGDFTLAGDSLSNPLPVTLVDLKATALNNDVLVNWSTAMEMNNKGFYVEKSVNGTDFSRIGFVEGNGTTQTTTNYQLLDERAFEIANTLYYRLRQVDMDGTEHLSKVVSVSRTERTLSAATVAPNPFTGVTTLQLIAAEAGNYTVTITDIQGRTVATRNVAVSKGLNDISLVEFENAGAGVYFVQLNGADSKTIKVVKTAN
jgi:hypothetical protein